MVKKTGDLETRMTIVETNQEAFTKTLDKVEETNEEQTKMIHNVDKNVTRLVTIQEERDKAKEIQARKLYRMLKWGGGIVAAVSTIVGLITQL